MGESRQPVEAERITSSWENLPGKLLKLISRRIRLRDSIKFRIVCKAWRAAVKQYHKPLLVVSYPNTEYPPSIFDLWDTIRADRLNGMHFMGSSHGWFILSRDKPLECSLLNYFTNTQISLPPWDPILNRERAYLSSPPTSPNCTVLLIGESLPGFAFCKPGASEWNAGKCIYPFYSNKGEKDYLQQAVALRGKFYALSYQGYLAAIDDVLKTKDLTVFKTNKVRPSQPVKDYHQYLVECQGEILVVLFWSSINFGQTDNVEVFRWDFPSSSWVRIHSLGDQVLLLGPSSSGAILSSPGDHIIFPVENNIWRTFDMKNKRFLVKELPGADKNSIWVLPTFV